MDDCILDTTWIVGKKGLLTLEIQSLMKTQGLEFVATGRDDLDYASGVALIDFIEQNEINSIINCAAYTNVDACEKNRELAFQVNSILPRVLAEISESKGIRFIHISTDYVFGSDNYHLFKEDDSKKPINYYGLTKAFGEDFVISNSSNFVIVRTSWLYGSKRPSFIVDRIEDLKKGISVSLISDLFGSPTNVNLLARNIIGLLHDASAYGIYHINSLGHTSWYEFAKFVGKHLEVCPEIFELHANSLQRDAKRAKWSILDHTRLTDLGFPKLESWQNGVESFLNASN